MKDKVAASIDWLRENYSHIWDHLYLTVAEKAGFLAACCDTRRCYLGTLSLYDRVRVIGNVLAEGGKYKG